jgi:hypothetical protein
MLLRSVMKMTPHLIEVGVGGFPCSKKKLVGKPMLQLHKQMHNTS